MNFVRGFPKRQSCTVRDFPKRQSCTLREVKKNVQGQKIQVLYEYNGLQLLGSNEIAWSVVLPDTCGFENGPSNRQHQAIKGTGKTCLFWLKIKW